MIKLASDRCGAKLDFVPIAVLDERERIRRRSVSPFDAIRDETVVCGLHVSNGEGQMYEVFGDFEVTTEADTVGNLDVRV